MASPVTGLHHVTALSGPAQANVDFYAGRLGLRLVKRTVNFDDPTTYHLYYADGFAHPGSFLTFFPYEHANPGHVGEGQAAATAYAVPEGAVDWWTERFASEGLDFGNPTERFTDVNLRFGRRVLPFRDPDGLALELVETPAATEGWTDGPIPPEAALGAFFAVTLCVADPGPTARLLTDVLGYREAGEAEGPEGPRLRLENPRADRAAFVDLHCAPGTGAGRMGAGAVHHVAFRVPSDEAQLEVREMLLQKGYDPTPVIDRQYFHSIYFREPGGVLFEIATDPPGFAVDEPADRLGTSLKLPPQYEGRREQIERRLPPLRVPYQEPA